MSGTSAGARRRWANATEEQKRAMGRRTADDPTEFYRRVNKLGPKMPHMKTRCWLWTGSTRGGYGRFRIKGKFFNAHVHAFEMAHGPLGRSKRVCHHCDNRACVRHDHLFRGTQHDNILDAVSKGRHKNPVLSGEHNPASRLTRKQVEELRRNPPARGEAERRAKALGISRGHLSRLLRGERWRGPEAALIQTRAARVES